MKTTIQELATKADLITKQDPGALRIILGPFGAAVISELSKDQYNEAAIVIDEWLASNYDKFKVSPLEMVLGVSRAHVERITGMNSLVSGFFTVPDNHTAQQKLTEASVFQERSDELEQDASFKQLIPYCVVFMAGKVLIYTRGKSGAEDRLHNKRSVGVGGHINPEDTDGATNFSTICLRELQEEIGVTKEQMERIEFVGFVNDDENPVGSVHLGLVFLVVLTPGTVLDFEEHLNDGEWVSPLDIEVPTLETWSQMALIPALNTMVKSSDELGKYRVGTPHPSSLSREDEDELVLAGYNDAQAHHIEGRDCVNPFAPDSANHALWQRGADNFKQSLTRAGSDGPVPKETGGAQSTPKTRDTLANDDQKRGWDDTKDAVDSGGATAHCPFTKEDRVKDWQFGASVFINNVPAKK